jgi:sugar fermentation stimulation protein A
VSTRYQESYVLLDTIKINDIFEQLLHQRLIRGLSNICAVSREVKFRDSRFDFVIELDSGVKVIAEVKSCTLCHNGVAMFPDAPTGRGKKHLKTLEHLSSEGFQVCNFYCITNRRARIFMPNFHTDLDYCLAFMAAKGVTFRALRIPLNNPVTVELKDIQEIPIDLDTTRECCSDSGSYILILRNPRLFHASVGSLGLCTFQPGFYVYIGSAKRGLSGRTRRHLRKRKRIRWHIDYISPLRMVPDRIYEIRCSEALESRLADAFSMVCTSYISGFGATDTLDASHLFYFDSPPYMMRAFSDILLDFRVFSR